MVFTFYVVKYFYKYVYKRLDWASVRVAEVDVNPDQPTVIDEIKNYVDARYLSASEYLWHLFGFPMQDCYPTVQKLQLHLHDNHQILYTKGEEAAALDRPVNTTLTDYFDTVRSEKNDPLPDTEVEMYPRAPELNYADIPTYYTWERVKWNCRKNPKQSDTIGRIYSAHMSSGERFYMRKLLLHTPGVESFDHLRIFEGVQCNSYKETFIAVG